MIQIISPMTFQYDNSPFIQHRAERSVVADALEESVIVWMSECYRHPISHAFHEMPWILYVHVYNAQHN